VDEGGQAEGALQEGFGARGLRPRITRPQGRAPQPIMTAEAQATLPSEIQQRLVYTQIVRQLGMERAGQTPPLTD